LVCQENEVEREGKKRAAENGLNPSTPGRPVKAVFSTRPVAMTKYVLFIRDHGTNDVLDFHPSEMSAKKALVAYVTEKTGRDVPSDPEAAVEEIASYFNRDKTFYAIAGVSAGAR
jgi:hypothetical protein